MNAHPPGGCAMPRSAAPASRAAILTALQINLVISTGCGDVGVGAESAFEVTDSAGIEIVRNGPIGAPGRSVLPRTEALRIGVVEGPPEYELFNVRDIAVGANGDIFAAFQNDGEVRVYAADGAYVRTVGRQGEGPGEFRVVTWIGVFGDTLLVFDPQLFRITVFSTAGDLLDTWQVRKGGGSIFPRARSAAGWLIELDDFTARVRYDIGRPGTDTARIAVVPSVADAIASLSANAPPWQVFDVILKHPSWTIWGIGSPGGPVFGRNALWDSRERHAYDAGGRIYLARGSRYAIDVFDALGTPVRRVTRSHEPVPVTDELIDRYRRAVMTHYDTTPRTGEAGLDLVRAAEQQIALPRPGHLPVLGEIVVSDDGEIWVERPDLVDDPLLLEWTRAGSPPKRWDVFDRDGRFIGTVQMPARSTLHVVGADWIIVTERNEMDVQYIVKYTIGRDQS